MIKRLKHLTHTAKIHQGFRRYFANTSWVFAEQILRMVAGLLLGFWIARYLGPEQFGVFSYAIAFAALFSSIAKLGLDGILVRDLVKEPELRDVYLGTAFWLKLIGALLMLGIVAIVKQLTSTDALTDLYILIIASGAIFQSFEVVDFYFQSKVLSKFVSISKMTQLLISSFLKLYFIFTGAELIYFVIVTLLDQVTLALSLFIAYRFQKLGGFYSHFDTKTAKQLLKDSWPLIFSGLVIIIYMRIDQIMIKEMLGEREVGLFSAAVRLSEAWYFIPVIISSSLFPSIVNAKKISEELYLGRLQRLYSVMIWLAITVALPLTFTSNFLVILLYGEAYKEAGQVLAIHIWAGVFVFIGVASSKWFLSEGLQRHLTINAVAGAIMNIVLNLCLIPKYGICGSAIATVISQAVASYLMNIIFRRTRLNFFRITRSVFSFS
ncbi:MAG: flippase [Methylococcales bacterium]|nr:flippase [Methylococcales bacterium]